jgi:arsenite methyltransferase
MHEAVQDYYGKVLAESDDLKTNACKTDAAMPEYLKRALAGIHDDVLSRYYGCGLVFPEKLEGMTILDLGCGAGRDVYLLSQLVGASGRVIGVDMTSEQLEVAGRHVGHHAKQFGYDASNVEFHHGYIEKLDELGLEAGSVDIVVSNCVLNLAPDKPAVLRGVERLLKPGGELYFADVYADRRIPAALTEDPELYGECLSGALYWNDFLSMAKAAGFADPRLVTDRRLTIENPSIEERIGHIGFFSATYRLFKLGDLETHCEDYGQAVIYRGGIAHHEQVFELDSHHRIERDKVFPVCGNTWRMLHDTRFREHFEFIGDFSTHFGIFEDCGTPTPFTSAGAAGEADPGGCC